MSESKVYVGDSKGVGRMDRVNRRQIKNVNHQKKINIKMNKIIVKTKTIFTCLKHWTKTSSFCCTIMKSIMLPEGGKHVTWWHLIRKQLSNILTALCNLLCNQFVSPRGGALHLENHFCNLVDWIMILLNLSTNMFKMAAKVLTMLPDFVKTG